MDGRSAEREQNRRAWNSVAARRDEVRGFPDGGFFARGGTTLDDVEVEALGDVSGKRLLHMGCASGGDTLSWAARGADVVGVDISEVAIEVARAKAAEAAIDALFVPGDVLDLPSELQEGNFDIVYVKAGVLCWMSSITGWANSVAQALRRDGRVFVYEMHPLAQVLEVTGDSLSIDWSYFGREPELVTDPLLTGVETDQHRFQFTWPLGDVVTAVAQSGMRMDRLVEYPGGQAPLDKLPMSFLLLATKVL